MWIWKGLEPKHLMILSKTRLSSSPVCWGGQVGWMKKWTGTGKKNTKKIQENTARRGDFFKITTRGCSRWWNLKKILRIEAIYQELHCVKFLKWPKCFHKWSPLLHRYDVLSPGEMQRLSFARLFYLQPKYACWYSEFRHSWMHRSNTHSLWLNRFACFHFQRWPRPDFP